MELRKFEVGDLVYYVPSNSNEYAQAKHLGVVIKIKKDSNPLFSLHKETAMFADEYVVKWIESGYTSTLLPFNLRKLEIPVDKKV